MCFVEKEFIIFQEFVLIVVVDPKILKIGVDRLESCSTTTIVFPVQTKIISDSRLSQVAVHIKLVNDSKSA